ncbi:hypothetical protein BGX31_002153, partial [Mortierella sp. GBA43]
VPTTSSAPAAAEAAPELSTWSIPRHETSRAQSSHYRGPLPLPIQLRVSRPQSKVSLEEPLASTKVPSTSVVIGSQPLFYLAKRFPLLAEQELNGMPKKTALDYSSFLVGAMQTPYPSATTIRAVIRQFKNFLRDSLRQKSASSSSSSSSSTSLELPKARVWAQVIRGLIRLKQYREARVAIHAMRRLGIKPTGYTWRTICLGWIDQGEFDRAEALAVKVFTDPSISHDYQHQEQSYFFTSKHQPGGQSTLPESATDFEAKRRHWSPMTPNSAPLFLIIQVLAQRGQMERARHWYDQIPEHEMTDMITSHMVAGYLKVGQQEKAQEVIRIMASCGVKPTAIIFNPIVEHAAQNVGMSAAEELVDDMVGIGLFLSLYTYKILMHGYIASGQRDKALQCLDRIRASGVETNRALGRILLNDLWGIGSTREGDYGPPVSHGMKGYPTEQELQSLDFVGKAGWSQRCIQWIKNNQYEQAEEAIQQALDLSGATSDIEIVHVIQALADHRGIPRARYWLDRFMSLDGLQHDENVLVELMNNFVLRYIKKQQTKEAEAVIRSMSEHGVYPTVETTNIILRGSTLYDEMVVAETFVQSIVEAGILPNQETYEILCQGYASRGELESLRGCLTRMEDLGFGRSTWSPSTRELEELLLGRQGSHAAEQSQEPDALASSSSPSSILDTLCAQCIEQGHIGRADRFVKQLVSNTNVPADRIPFATLIQGWIDQSQQNAMVSFTDATLALSSSSDSPTTTTTTSSSSVSSSKSLDQELRLRNESISKMRKARFWFDKIPDEGRTLDLVNRMIGGYMTLGQEEESEDLIKWLALRKIKPNVVTYNHILRHTVQRVTMPAAEGLVSKMQKGGLEPNIETWNLLIRGYVIRGQLRNALQCLDRMAGKNQARAGASRAGSGSGSGSRIDRSKTRVEIDKSDHEIVEAAVQSEDSDNTLRKRSAAAAAASTTSTAAMSVEPNEATVRLILSGFGSEPRFQGQGDSSHALELYKSRLERQTQQEEMLLEGLALLRQADAPGFKEKPSLKQHSGVDSKKEDWDEDEEGWIVEHIGTLQKFGALSDSDIGMTDVDWKIELKWEEMMEMEKEHERELSEQGRFP